MTKPQADKLMILYRKAVKAGMKTERVTPGTATHSGALDDFQQAKKAFEAYLYGLSY